MSSWQASGNGLNTYIWICATTDFSKVYATDGTNIYLSNDGGNNYSNTAYWTIPDPGFSIIQICCTSSLLLVLSNSTNSTLIYNINTTTTSYVSGSVDNNVLIFAITISDQATPLFFAISDSFTYYTTDVTTVTWSTVSNLTGGISIAVSNNVTLTGGNIYVVGIDNQTIYSISSGYGGIPNTYTFPDAGIIYCSTNSSTTSNSSLITTGYSGGTNISFSSDSGNNYSNNNSPLGVGITNTISGAYLNLSGTQAVLITSPGGIYINNISDFSSPFSLMNTAPSSTWTNIVGDTNLDKMAASRSGQIPYFFGAAVCYCEDSLIETSEGEEEIQNIKGDLKI
jgi:hypothetical protein